MMTSTQITFQLSPASEKIISNVLKDEAGMSEQDLFQDIMTIFCATWQLPKVAQTKIILRKKQKAIPFQFKWKKAKKFSATPRILTGREAVFLVRNILRHENLEETPNQFFDSTVKNYERLRKKVNDKGYTALLVYPNGEESIIASP